MKNPKPKPPIAQTSNETTKPGAWWAGFSKSESFVWIFAALVLVGLVFYFEILVQLHLNAAPLPPRDSWTVQTLYCH